MNSLIVKKLIEGALGGREPRSLTQKIVQMDHADPKTRREQKGKGKDKGRDSPYSAKHVRLASAAAASSASKPKKEAKKK